MVKLKKSRLQPKGNNIIHDECFEVSCNYLGIGNLQRTIHSAAAFLLIGNR